MVRYRSRTWAILALLGASCNSFGAKKLVSSHTAYNDAVQLTVTREVLSNIVRSRYADPMQFLAVQSINAQFSVNAGGSATAAGIGQAGSTGAASGTIGYSDSPTITYVPQSDAGFYKSMFGSMDLESVIGFSLANRFAQSDRERRRLSIRFAFSAINRETDFVNATRNPVYERRVDAYATLLESGAYYLTVPEWDYDTTNIEKAKVTSEDMIAAFSQGLNFIEEDGGKTVRLARYRQVLALVLPDPTSPDVQAALDVLGVARGRDRYLLRPPSHAVPGTEDPHAIWMTPRSIVDTLIVASQFVRIPADDARIAPRGVVDDANLRKAPFKVLNSREEPPFPYRVQHRGTWFYVDDEDRASRSILEGLVAAYASRVGRFQSAGAGPSMVLPVGG